MASIILTVVGTAIGGPIGGLIGNFAGGLIDNAVFGGGGGSRFEGPRLKDLNVQSSAYGEVVPLVYGTLRLPGNVVWSSGLKENRSEETQGGGKGSPSVTSVTFTYTASFAVALSGRPIEDVGRIWADGKLLRNSAGTLGEAGSLRIYKGGEDQDIDPLIEATEGIDNANAFRGLSLVVFEDLALGEYANRIPNLTFEVIGDGGNDIALENIVGDICTRAGIAEIDASELDQRVRGYIVSGPVAARAVLEQLADMYQFDMAEQEGVLSFRKLSRSSVVTLTGDDFGRRDEAKTRISRTQELELPREVGLGYLDPARDYQWGLQRARRLNSPGERVLNKSVQLVLSAAEAKAIAENGLDVAWKRRLLINFHLPARFSDLAPGDVITLPLKKRMVKILLQEVENAGMTLECQGISYGEDVPGRDTVADSGTSPGQVVLPLQDTVLSLMDMPLIRAENTNVPMIFWAASHGEGRWPGAALFVSRDAGDSYQQLDQTVIAAVTGTVDTVLGQGSAAFWDEVNDLLVDLDEEGVLESQTRTAVLNGANLAWVGGEIIQFRNATQEMDGRYRLSGLLRGRRGTEYKKAGHMASEKFILLSESSTISASLSPSDVAKSLMFKAVTFGQEEALISPLSLSYMGNNLKPFSPVHPLAVRDSNNLTISWIRRSRVGGEWLDNTDVPLGELYEKYDVEILDGATLKRTLTATTPQVIYTQALQIEDFGSVPAEVSLRIYQISDLVGRGHPLTVTL